MPNSPRTCEQPASRAIGWPTSMARCGWSARERGIGAAAVAGAAAQIAGAALPRRPRCLPPFLDDGRAGADRRVPRSQRSGRSGSARCCSSCRSTASDACCTPRAAGRSGETYAFDARGRWSRRAASCAQLRASALLPKPRTSACSRSTLRDPGGDLTRGFRSAAAARDAAADAHGARAVAGGDGVDVDGYRDYRGVPVVGAWRWLPEFGLGVATEVDVDEAFRTLHSSAAAVRSADRGAGAARRCSGCSRCGARAASARRAQRAERHRRALRPVPHRAQARRGRHGRRCTWRATSCCGGPAAIKLLREDRADAAKRSRASSARCGSPARSPIPNTVAIYDYGRTEDGTLYYAMEYLEGLDLQRLVTRFGPLPQARVMHFLRQLCGSLAEAHAAGARAPRHQAGEPDRVPRGGVADTLKVLDFGVAKSLRASACGCGATRRCSARPSTWHPELFESPEQAQRRRRPVRGRRVAYFLLTGSAAVRGHLGRRRCAWRT